MKISNKKKVATIPEKDLKGAMKIYKNNPSSLNSATYAAAFKAKQLKKDMVVIQGNSYMHKIYNIEPIDGSLKKYTVMKSKTNVVIATPKGEIYQAVAKTDDMKEEKNMSLINKYLNESMEDNLLNLIKSAEGKGITSTEITRLMGRKNQFKLLKQMEKQGKVKSIPTNRRDLGRRWFTPEYYTEW